MTELKGILILILLISSFGMSESTSKRASDSDLKAQASITGGAKTKYAWVSFLYGTTYFWPLRVMQRSLRNQKTNYDIVTLVDQDVPEEYRRILREEDHTRVLDIPATIKNPYQDEKIYQNRFGAVMSKLNMFNLTEYEKIVYLDADTMIISNSDSLFDCGDFCAVFINPCIFNSGVMVISPSTTLFRDMIEKVPILPSYDGADQGFLNSYFSDLLASPLWDPNAPKILNNVSKVMERPKLTGNYRLPTYFHVDHFLYYQRGKWDMPCLTPKILEYMGPAFMKPWNWWTYSVMDLSWAWLDVKESIRGSHHTGPFIGYLLQTLVIVMVSRFLFQTRYRTNFANWIQRKKRTEGVLLMQSLSVGFILLCSCIFFSFFVLIDPSTHPKYAFVTFFLWMHGMVPFFYYGWLTIYLYPHNMNKLLSGKVAPITMTSKELVYRTLMLASVPFFVFLFCAFTYKTLGLVFLFHKIAFLIFGAVMQIFSFFFFFGMSASFWMQAYSQENSLKH